MILHTIHKPLTFIFDPEKGIFTTALQRIQRWRSFSLVFASGSSIDPAKKTTRPTLCPVLRKLSAQTLKEKCIEFTLSRSRLGQLESSESNRCARRRVAIWSFLGWWSSRKTDGLRSV